MLVEKWDCPCCGVDSGCNAEVLKQPATTYAGMGARTVSPYDRDERCWADSTIGGSFFTCPERGQGELGLCFTHQQEILGA